MFMYSEKTFYRPILLHYLTKKFYLFYDDTKLQAHFLLDNFSEIPLVVRKQQLAMKAENIHLRKINP